MKIRNFTDVKSLFFDNKTLKQTIFKNISWLIVAEVISKGIGFLVVVWLARHFGPTIYGQWAFALSFVAIFAVLADFGFSTLTVREIARDKFKSAKYIDNIIGMKLILGLVTLGLIAFVIQFLGKEPEIVKLVYFLGIYVVLNTFATFFHSIFRANEKMEYEAASRVIQSVSLLGLVAFFILNKGSILTISYAYLSAVLIGIIFTLIFIRCYFSKFFLKINFEICQEIFKEAWPIGLVALATTICYSLGSVLLGLMRSDIEVGWYNAASRIIFAIIPFSSIFFFSFFPQMSRAFKESYDNLKNVVEKYALLMFGVGLPLGIGGFIVAPELIKFLYGQPYLETTLPFQILVWNLTIIFMITLYGNSLWALDKQKDFLKAVLIGATFNIAANLVLIPKYGIIGAAIAALLTEIVIFIKVSIEFNKTIKINLKNILLPTGVSSISMALVLIGVKEIGIMNPILLILCGGIIYILILYFYIRKNLGTMIKI
ncbi:MAG: flippase [Candidatus Nealsonbacteria bacterium]